MISFGPVPSRRLGNSLGINNIISPKTCSYSCIYCQVGKTKKLTIKRESFFSTDIIHKEIEMHLRKISKESLPDYLTFVANGEPTLDINLGKTIDKIKSFGIPIAVITNATLLYLSEVREELQHADWVSVKLDTLDENIWRKINMPEDQLNFNKQIESIYKFSKEFKGLFNTETMLLNGVNDQSDGIVNIASFIKTMRVNKSYLSIPIRPPAFSEVKPASPEKVNFAYQTFTRNGINTELLTGFEGTGSGFTGNAFDDILNITAVHPLREDSMRELLKHNHTDKNVVYSLLDKKLIKEVHYNDHTYYIRQYQIDSK